jgi:hypothetical protein
MFKIISNLKIITLILFSIIILLFIIEIISSLAIVVKYKHFNTVISNKNLDRFILLSPFYKKPKVEEERCNSELYINAKQIENTEYVQDDSLLGWRLIPNTKYCYIRDKPIPAEVFITNHQGFTSIGSSDFSYNRIKPKNTFRVIVVGGSTVWGVGTRKPENNLPARIKLALKKRYPNIKFELINAGIAGYSSRNELLYIMSELVYFNPDLIISYGGWNDSTFNGYMQNYDGNINGLKTANHRKIELQFKKNEEISSTLSLFLSATKNKLSDKLRWSATYAIIDRLINTRSLNFDDVQLTVHDTFNQSSIELYENNLKMKIMASKVYNFKIGIFLQPLLGILSAKVLTEEETYLKKLGVDGMKIKKDFYIRAIPVMNKLKNEFSINKNVCLADLSKSLDKVKETVYNDPGHINVIGNDAVANKIVDELVSCNLIK